MRSGWWRVIAGLLIIVAGVLLLLVQFKWITLDGPFWGPLFLLGGAAVFLALWLGDRAEWWPLIPGGVLIVTGLSEGSKAFERLFEVGWPLIFVFVGLLLLAGAFGLIGRKGPEQVAEEEEFTGE